MKNMILLAAIGLFAFACKPPSPAKDVGTLYHSHFLTVPAVDQLASEILVPDHIGVQMCPAENAVLLSDLVFVMPDAPVGKISIPYRECDAGPPAKASWHPVTNIKVRSVASVNRILHINPGLRGC